MKSDQDPNNFEEKITMSSRYLLDNKIRKLVEYLKKKCSTCLIIGYRVQMFQWIQGKITRTFGQVSRIKYIENVCKL